MSGLWTALDAAKATGGKTVGDWVANGVSIDTRSLQPGDLFVALTDQRDGHDFVAQALENGAAAALVSRVPDGVTKDAPLLIVDDVLEGLQALGVAARARTKARVIAVTGSVGKTTTKEMLRTALAGQGRVHAAVMSLNNHWGVPLTLARMPANTDFALLEIGMSNAGEITPLTLMARPHVAVITTVAMAHMAAFDSLSDIARAKAEIFDGLEENSIAVLNRDIESFDLLSDAAKQKNAKILTFGEAENADYRLKKLIPGSGSTTVSALVNTTESLFKLSAPGHHLAINALAVLAATEAAGADATLAALALASWLPPQGRGERHWILLDPVEEEQKLELIDEAYNANPASMAAAFEVLATSSPVDGLGRINRGRRIAFVTDMLELGEAAENIHKKLADLAAVEALDKLHAAGPLSRHFYDALRADQQGEWHDDAAGMAAQVHRLLDAGDVVMVKGSKGSKASLIVDAIKKLSQAVDNNNKGTR